MGDGAGRKDGALLRALRIAAGLLGCALLLVSAALAVVFVGQGSLANVFVIALPPALLGGSLAAVARRPGRWPLATAVALVAVLIPVGMLFWFSLNRYGNEPVYDVGSLGELRADLSADCPGIRFPDLEGYEGRGDISYKVRYCGGRITMSKRSYLILFRRSGGAGGEALPKTLEVGSRDLRGYEGDGVPAPRPRADMVLSGVDVEQDGGHLRFVMEGYLYEVAAVSESEDLAREAAREVALSIIDQ